MAIDRRGYYYRSRRINGKPRREYIASGEVARMFAEVDAGVRVLRQEDRQRLHAAQAAAKAFDAELDRLDELADLWMSTLMLAAGFHRHDRGSWRKRRERPTKAGG